MINNKIVVAVDVGTTKICTLVAEMSDGGNEYEIVGYGECSSKGLSKGLVIDVSEVARDVQASVKLAEKKSGVEIENAFIGIAGKHIESMMSKSKIIINKNNNPREITQADIDKLIESDNNKITGEGKMIIHKIVHNYKVDGEDVVRNNPLGMYGNVLEADIHIITGRIGAIQTLESSIRSINLKVDEVVLEPLGSANAVLTDTEKELGAILVDIGGGTTDIAFFRNKKMVYTSVIPLGGEYYTKDLAHLLNIDIPVAETLKRSISSRGREFPDNEIIEIAPHGDMNTDPIKEASIKFIRQIIDSRNEDILENINKKIIESGMADFSPSGIIFTGGASQIAGLKTKAEEFFDLPIRFGVPLKKDGIPNELRGPKYSTAIGMIDYAVEKYRNEDYFTALKKEDHNFFEMIVIRVKDWISDRFW